MRILAAAALLSCLLSMTSCAADQKQPTLLGSTVPGLGDLYAPSKEEKAEDAWWDKFYGKKSSGE